MVINYNIISYSQNIILHYIIRNRIVIVVTTSLGKEKYNYSVSHTRLYTQ